MQTEMTPEEVAAVERCRKAGVVGPNIEDVLCFVRNAGVKTVLESSYEEIIEAANAF